MATARHGAHPEHPKMKGSVLGEFHGIVVYVRLKKAKKQGKNRIWVQIRQADNKPFRVSESLSYARSVDILFVEDPAVPK